ncbi:MAG: NAD-dependent succinate-semialdehyde dehydrogenase [Gammaproteobacteria bacterium]|nr:NAD-dependent succinate-semialdehyde dehydrogenase [Gammaproteobacteria bacterium]
MLSVDYSEPELLLGGVRVALAREREPVFNPATGEQIGSYPLATTADLDVALAAAQRGFEQWRGVTAHDRGKVLKRAAQLLRERGEGLARLAALESGKSIHEARIELNAAADLFEWYGEECRRVYGRLLVSRGAGTRLTVRKEPIGPVAAFAPWNFPLGNPARKLGAPLATGCSVIMKPAEDTPASALAIAQSLLDAGLPPDTLSIVFGVPAQISTYLLASPVIRKVSFTGSTVVGKQLLKLAAEGAKRTTMELGGHAPVLVFGDVDVDAVLDLAVAAKFRNAGQVCVSPTRFYVHESIYQRFAAGFAARVQSWPVGDGLDESQRMGPLIHPRRLPVIQGFVDDARDRGARVLAGGTRLERRGWFYAPTVLADVPDEARIMNEEPFGPIAVLNPFRDHDAVVHAANRLPYGLAAYAFTESRRTAALLGEQIEAGMVGINTFRIGMSDAPFGGVKESGHGSEEGPEGLEACLVTKFVSEA